MLNTVFYKYVCFWLTQPDLGYNAWANYEIIGKFKIYEILYYNYD